MDIERSIDGMVGRLLSWLTQAPAHSPVRVARSAEPIAPVPEVAKPTSKKPAAKKPAAKKSPAKKSPVKKAAAKEPAAKKPAVKKSPAKKSSVKKAAAKEPAAKRRPPKRRAPEKPAARKAAPKPVAAPADDLDRFVEGAGRATGESDLDRFVAGVGRTTGGGDDLTARILAELAKSEEGATLAELQSATGGQLAAVRRTLNQLLKAGRIHRGKGIGTRYRLE